MKKRNYAIFIFLISLYLGFINFTDFPEWTEPKQIPYGNFKYVNIWLERNFIALKNGKIFLSLEADTILDIHRNSNIYVYEIYNDSVMSIKNVSNSIYDCKNPAITAAKNNVAHLVYGVRSDQYNRDWVDNPIDVYHTCYSDNKWSDPEKIYTKRMNVNNDAFISGQLCADDDNNIHLIWMVKDSSLSKLLYNKYQNNKWGVEKELSFSTGVKEYGFIADNKKIYLAYFKQTSLVFRYSDDGSDTWSREINVPIYRSCRKIKILQDCMKIIHVFCIGQKNDGTNDIFHSYSNDGILWSNEYSVSLNNKNLYQNYDIITDNNKLTLFGSYNEYISPNTFGESSMFYSFWDSAKWNDFNGFKKNSSFRAVCRDSNGYIHLIYNSNMMYTHTKLPVITEIKNSNVQIKQYSLSQNYPNPFNPSTVISYQLPVYSKITLKIFDVLGREVETLIDEYKPAGSYKVEFNASDLASGVYLYKMTAGNFSQVRKMILIR